MPKTMGGAEFGQEPDDYWTQERVDRFIERHGLYGVRSAQAQTRSERVAEAAPYLGDAMAHRSPPEHSSPN